MTRRTWILLGLLAASLLLALAARDGGGGDGSADATAARRTPARTTQARGRGDAQEPVREVVALAGLDVGDVAETYEPGRDPFRFYQPPPPPPEPAPPPVPPPPPRVAPPPPPPEPAVPQPPPVDVQYLGRFGPEDDPIAVFSNGEEIYNVRTGGVIQGKFRVARIGYESADLAFVGFPDAPAERLPIGAGRGRGR